MLIKNTSTRYGFISKLLHWLMAFLLIFMFIIAYVMINIDKSTFRSVCVNFHKSIGLILLGLVGLRLVWREINPTPVTKDFWLFHQLAQLNIFLLYALMFIMPITGILRSTLGGHIIPFFNFFIIPAFSNNKGLAHFFSEAHEISSYILIAAFALHVIGTIYHHYLRKDDVLKRMWIK